MFFYFIVTLGWCSSRFHNVSYFIVTLGWCSSRFHNVFYFIGTQGWCFSRFHSVSYFISTSGGVSPGFIVFPTLLVLQVVFLKVS